MWLSTPVPLGWSRQGRLPRVSAGHSNCIKILLCIDPGWERVMRYHANEDQIGNSLIQGEGQAVKLRSGKSYDLCPVSLMNGRAFWSFPMAILNDQMRSGNLGWEIGLSVWFTGRGSANRTFEVHKGVCWHTKKWLFVDLKVRCTAFPALLLARGLAKIVWREKMERKERVASQWDGGVWSLNM